MTVRSSEISAPLSAPSTTMEGLVDLAADTNARIIQDEHLGHYVVFGDEFHYLYEPLGRESL